MFAPLRYKFLVHTHRNYHFDFIKHDFKMRSFDDNSISARVVRRYRMRNRILIIASTILSILLIILASMLIHHARKQQSVPHINSKTHGSSVSSSSTTTTTFFLSTIPINASKNQKERE